MTWSSGSGLLCDVWADVREYVPEKFRAKLLVKLMRHFAQEDCDTLDEVVRDDWPESGRAYRKYNKD